MSSQNEAETLDTSEHDQETDGSRQRSTIQFPYVPLEDAIEVAQGIHGNVGHGECDDDQLAAWLKLSPKSSGFRIRIYAARMFGVIGTGPGHKLSQLGQEIVDPQSARAAKVRAFLSVPLYSTVFSKYKGAQLPPAAAFEREIVQLGVSEKQKERARQVLERSADQAGFFEQGRNRLVKPGIADSSDQQGSARKNEGGGGGNDGGDGQEPPSDRLALIKQLVRYLPENLTNEKLAQWLRAAEMNLRLTHDVPGEIKIEVVGGK